MRRILIAAACLMVAAQAHAADYYVNPAINANSGTGTLADPFGDLQHALNSVTRDTTNGDFFHVKAGAAEVMAAQLSFVTYGTPNVEAPVTIKGYTAAKDDGGIADIDLNGGAFSFVREESVYLRHLKIHNNSGANTLVKLLAFGACIDCEVYDGGERGVVAHKGSMVYNCHIHDCVSSGIWLPSGRGQGVAYGNYVVATPTADAGILVDSNHTFVSRNIVIVPPSTGVSGIEFDTGGNVLTHNSVYHMGTGTAFEIDFRIESGIVINNVARMTSTGLALDYHGDRHPPAMIGNNASFAENDTRAPDRTTGIKLPDFHLDASPFEETGEMTFANRYAFFRPADSIHAKAYPFGSGLDLGAVQHNCGGPAPAPDPDPMPHPEPTPDGKVVDIHHGHTMTIAESLDLTTFNIHGTLILEPGAEIIIRDHPIDTTLDPEQLGHGILVHDGGSIVANGTPKTPFVRETGGVAAGDTTLTLVAAPEGWWPGDKLVIPDTRQKMPGTHGPTDLTSQSEVVEVVAVDGATITITPTQFAHAVGPRPHLTPHIANLTRDVVIRSENPNGVRGHIMVMNGGTSDLQHALIKDMGRTIRSGFVAIDSTTFNPDGTVKHIGKNQIGRYPLHWHLLGGTLTPEGAVTVSVDGCVIWGSPGWAAAVHGTSGAEVRDCVAYDIGGAAFLTEDGTEVSTFEDCLAVRCKGPSHSGSGPDSSGSAGVGFWQPRVGSTFRRCIAADCEFSAFSWNGYASGNRTTVSPPPGVSKGCEGYASQFGVWRNWGQRGIQHEKWDRAVLEDFTLWHSSHAAVETYHEARCTFRGFKLYNDPAVSSLSEGSSSSGSMTRLNTGFFFFGTYENGGMHLEDCEVTGFNTGVWLPTHMAGGDEFLVTTATLANEVNFRADPSKNLRDARLSGITTAPSGMTRPPTKRGPRRGAFPPMDTLMWLVSEPTQAPLLGHSSVLLERERVYFAADPLATCQTMRERIIGGVVCP